MGVCIECVCVVYVSVLCVCVPAHYGYDKDWKGGSIRVLRPTCAINHSHLILLHQHQVGEQNRVVLTEIKIPLQRERYDRDMKTSVKRIKERQTS